MFVFYLWSLYFELWSLITPSLVVVTSLRPFIIYKLTKNLWSLIFAAVGLWYWRKRKNEAKAAAESKSKPEKEKGAKDKGEAKQEEWWSSVRWSLVFDLWMVIFDLWTPTFAAHLTFQRRSEAPQTHRIIKICSIWLALTIDRLLKIAMIMRYNSHQSNVCTVRCPSCYFSRSHYWTLLHLNSLSSTNELATDTTRKHIKIRDAFNDNTRHQKLRLISIYSRTSSNYFILVFFYSSKIKIRKESFIEYQFFRDSCRTRYDCCGSSAMKRLRNSILL